MRVLMLVMTDVVHDARVRREAQTLAEAGHTVHVLARAPQPAGDAPSGVSVTWLGSRSPLPGGAGGMRTGEHNRLVRAARWLLLPAHRRLKERAWCRAADEAASDLRADVVHAHDLPTLALAVELASRWKAHVVYDSHECWTMRRYEGRPAPLALRRQRRREAELGHRCSTVLTVSAPLAEWFRNAYHWDHVHVVRNSFSGAPGKGPRRPPRGLIYAGRIGPDRDLRTLASASERLDLDVTLMGPQDESFVSRFHPRAARLVHGVPVEEVPSFVRAHGIAAVTLEDTSLNHRVALPNRLFQAVQAGVPVVASDLPALRNVVEEHHLGHLYRPGSTSSFVKAVHAVLEDYPALVASVETAQPAFSWERERERLLAVYEDLAAAT